MFTQGHEDGEPPNPQGEEMFHVTGWTSGEILFAYDHDLTTMIYAVQTIHDAACDILSELKAREAKAREN